MVIELPYFHDEEDYKTANNPKKAKELLRLAKLGYELKQHLKEIEWQYHTGSMGTTYYMCPACRGYKHSGHADDCWLHKAIKE
jgi:hypothetical protein